MTKAVGKDSNGQLWTEPVESAEVASATANWLSENIAQETGYVIDDSLSVTGAAADAKATGDQLREVTTNFDNLFKVDINWEDYATTNKPLGWHRGLYDNTGATYNNTLVSTHYICSNSTILAVDNYNYLFAKSFSDSYGILITEYDANGNYITTYGTGTGVGKVSQQIIKVYPTHLYGFSIGYISDDANSLITDENIENIKAYFVFSKTEVDPTNDINKNCVESSLGGHVVEYKTVGKPMEIYKNVNGIAEYSFSVPASDYIRCNKDYTYTLRINSSNESAKYYINIYDRSHNIDLTYSRTNGEGIINCFTAQELANYNGFQFSNLPDGYYIRYSISPYDTEYRMYVWDGVKCGLPLCSEQGSFDGNTYTSFPENGECIVTIPGGIKCVIAKPGYTFVGGRYINNGSYSNFSNSTYAFPSQIFQSSTELSKALIIRKDYNYTTGTFSKEMAECDMSPYMCVIPLQTSQGVFSTDNGFGRITYIRRRINDIEQLTWECKKDIGSFKEGVTYRGVPYRTEWTLATLFGWHITSKTFINAVNDPDSVFYNNEKNNALYSLVCSSYGSLVSLFPYPLTNYSMMHDPNFNIVYSNDMEIGALLSNGAPDGETSAGVGHCIIPLSKTQNSDSKLSTITIAENSSSGITHRRNAYSAYEREGKDCAVGAYGYFDLRNYVYNVQYLKDINVLTPYRIAPVFEPTNGSARPHKGDCSVYTSYGSIIINIKDPNADRIYYQKVSCTFDYLGIPKNVSNDGTANYILLSSISNNNKNSTEDSIQITLRSPTNAENGTYTGAIAEAGNADLESGSIYAVWASNGASTRPNNYELFEWYEIRRGDPIIYYNIEDGKLVIYSKENGSYVKANTNENNVVEFWYARTFARSVGESIRNSSAGFVSIPYEADNDYTKYADKFTIPLNRTVNNSDVPNNVFFYRKGKLGAYYQEGVKIS